MKVDYAEQNPAEEYEPEDMWIDRGVLTLDEVGALIGDPMISVAWDRDEPGLFPRPRFRTPPRLYGPSENFPPRMFFMEDITDSWSHRTYYGEVCLAYIDGAWSWRNNTEAMTPVTLPPWIVPPPAFRVAA